MSVLWFAPAVVLVVGTAIIARLVAEVRYEAASTDAALAEAGEALAIVSDDRRDLDEVLRRLAHGTDAVADPWRAASTSAAMLRGWWRRGRTPVRASDDVPWEP